MSDPYNSYPSHLPSPSSTSGVTPTRASSASTTTRSKKDVISRLDVSARWKERFRAIEKAGGADLPNARDLTPAERRLVSLNWLAFFFWLVYLPLKGLWRQAVSYLLIGIACVFAMELIGLGEISRAVGYGIGAVAMLRANVGYYKRVVLGEPSWV